MTNEETNGHDVVKLKDYTTLKDFKLEIEANEEKDNVCLSLWVYIINPSSTNTTFPATIIKQVQSGFTSDAPFLFLDEKKKMMLSPLLLIQGQACDPCNSSSLIEVPYAAMDVELPFERWIHVGCEIFRDVLRLHINGRIIGDRSLSFVSNKKSSSISLGKITLVGSCEDHGLLGYVYDATILCSKFSNKAHYLKDPPLQLLIDYSKTSEIEEESDGTWSIIGGKPSCRKIVSVDVVLLNAHGQVINKEVEVVASLLYADNGVPVEKTVEGEAPLLTTKEGVEFPSCDSPCKLINGRHSFKLKISQLSSKCDNRMFRIKFSISKFRGYHFFKAFSPPIHCVSRGRNPRPSSVICKRATSSIYPLNGRHSSGLDKGSFTFQNMTASDMNPSLSSKRIKLGSGNASMVEERPENPEQVKNSPSESDSREEKDSSFRITSNNGYLVSDTTIFRYCLGGLTDRAVLLKEVATLASEQELSKFAEDVSLYSGCSHHRTQIVIAKRLIEKGTKVWHSVSLNNTSIRWENVAFKIKEQFVKVAHSNARSLTVQDLEVLRRIAGCQESMAQENFEKLWCWLYPVAFTLSTDFINKMWNSTSPKWIEGFITKEEAEKSLQGPRGLQDPGTFVLRFPTSRSWPHPDAGSLVVTYVGRDHIVHHQILSLDYIHSCKEKQTNMKSLQDLLLEEPELSRLGRVVRDQ